MIKSRRTVLKSLLAGAAAGSLPAVALGNVPLGRETGASPDPSAPASPSDAPPPTPVPPAAKAGPPSPWELLAPASAGTRLGLGWNVESLSPIMNGAPVLELRHRSGTKARVHVHRNDGAPVGVARTKWLDFVLVNGGNGQSPTDESIGRVLIGLATTIRRREERSRRAEAAVAELRAATGPGSNTRA